MTMISEELLPCPFCGGAMQLRFALWASEGDRDAIIHNVPGGTSCPIEGAFSIDTFDNGVSVAEAWNRRASPSPAGGVQGVTDEMAIRLLSIRPFGDATIGKYLGLEMNHHSIAIMKSVLVRALSSQAQTTGGEVDQFIAAAKLLEDAGWKITRPALKSGSPDA